MIPPDNSVTPPRISATSASGTPMPNKTVTRTLARLRVAGTVAVVTIVAACSNVQTPNQDAVQETARYVAHAKRDYTPPGPREDPWGPYIRQASERFDVPEIWIRALMRVESGGNLYQNGELITSGAGAMGLMQVMPDTYDGLKERYSLGSDPFDPHDNIFAGVAYMREMYDIYGAPAFLAAYNAGPTRLDDYMANTRPLPDETRHYVAMIGPSLRGIYPNTRSAADEVASNTFPVNIPPGRRFGRPILLASNKSPANNKMAVRPPQEVAQRLEPRRLTASNGLQRVAMIIPPLTPLGPTPVPPQRILPPPVSPPAAPARGGFHLIALANAADAAPARHAGPSAGQWAIQVGAFAKQAQANSAVMAAQNRAHMELAVAQPSVASLRQGRMVVWRARMTGLSRDTAVQACEKITHTHSVCVVLAPDAQS